MWQAGPTIASSSAATFAPIHSFTFCPNYTPPDLCGVVVFFHGLGMHARMPRYTSLASSFSEAGFAFVAWDMPHHGTSSTLGTPGHACKPSRLPRNATQLTLDALTFVQAVRTLYPHVPVVLLGESLGASLAFQIAPIVQPLAIVSLAGLVKTWVVRWGTVLGGKVLGSLQLARMVARAPWSQVRKTLQDPLIATAPPRLSVFQCAFQLVRNVHTHVYPALRCPVLFSIGTRDALFSVGATTRAWKRCRNVAPWQRVLHIVDGGQHHDYVEWDEVVRGAVGFARAALAQGDDWHAEAPGIPP